MDKLKMANKIYNYINDKMKSVDSFDDTKGHQQLHVANREWHNHIFCDYLYKMMFYFVIAQLIATIVNGFLQKTDFLTITTGNVIILGFTLAKIFAEDRFIIKWKLELVQDKFNIVEKVVYIFYILLGTFSMIAVPFLRVLGLYKNLMYTLVIMYAAGLIVVFYIKYACIGTKIFSYNFYSSKIGDAKTGEVAANGGITILTESRSIEINLEEGNLYIGANNDIIYTRLKKFVDVKSQGQAQLIKKEDILYINIKKYGDAEDKYFYNLTKKRWELYKVN